MRLTALLLAGVGLLAWADGVRAFEGARLRFTTVLIGTGGKRYPGFQTFDLLPTGQIRQFVQSCDDDTAPNKWKSRDIAVLSTPGAPTKVDTFSCASTKEDGRTERSAFEISHRSVHEGTTWDLSYLARQNDDDGRGDKTYWERRHDVVVSLDGKRCKVLRFSDVKTMFSRASRGQPSEDTDRYDISKSTCKVEPL